MNAITLYIEDLNTLVKDLHPLHRERLLAALPAQLDNIKLRDALNLISYETYWVSKYRDLSDVKPLSVDSDYFAYDRQAMQPLLDALEKGDFELAEALTPAKYRLCGYQEYTEAKTEEERGIGWAGQFADIVVPAGIYPVFAREFQYHEAKHCYTNRLRDYSGFFTWVEGQCIASSYEQGKFPYPRTLTESPYCHAVAHSILEGRSQLQLELMYKGEPYAEPMLMQRDTLDGSYTFTAHDGTAFTLTVEKDPEQQRVGRTFTFQTDATDLPKTASYFNGKTCTVLEQVEPKLHYEPLAIGEMMWRVKFPDGEILSVFDDELQPIPRKKDLTTQIQGAEGKREPPTPTQEGNRKER